MRRSLRWAGLLGLCGGLIWLAWPESPEVTGSEPVPAGARAATAAAEAASAATPSSFWALAAQATAQADRSSAARLDLAWDDSAAGQQASAAWCARGKAAMAAVEAGASAVAAFEPDAHDRELKDARERVRRRWIAHLRAQASARAQAAADYLEAEPDPGGALARQRLLASARTASDPMVIALALQRAGGQVEPRRSLGQRWSQLEPANVHAWLAASGPLTAEEVLRGASQAAESRPYLKELVQLLLESPQARTPGLRDAAEAMLLVDIESQWELPNWRPVMDACRRPDLPAEQRPHCRALADTIWRAQDGALLNRVLAVRLAVTQGASSDPQWRARATQAEAARYLSREQSGEQLARFFALHQCDRQASQGLREELPKSEFMRLEEALQRAGADVEALAAKQRAQSKQALLEPLPPANQASR